MIALANETNTDMWINIPGPATDDYVTALANLIKNGDTVAGVAYPGLNPRLKVYVEYSNEVWGGSPNPTSYNNAAASQAEASGDSALNNDGSTDAGVWARWYYLQRTMQVGQDFANVFGAGSLDTTIRPVLGWQEGNWQYYTQNLPWFESTYGPPDRYFYGLGNADYLSSSDHSSVDAIIASLRSNLRRRWRRRRSSRRWARLLRPPGRGLRGGAGRQLEQRDRRPVWPLAASRDPRIEQIVAQNAEDFFAAGGGLQMFFDGPWGFWGPQWSWQAAEQYEASNPSLSAKYRGLLDVVAASPVVPTIGLPVAASGATSLPITDSLGQSFGLPQTGAFNDWALSVPQAGTYTLSVTTGLNADYASKFEAGQVQVSLADGTARAPTTWPRTARSAWGTSRSRPGSTRW